MSNTTATTGTLRVAIMQPYFFPYLGYFQLIAAADCFVVYDNVQFIKRGWIERNRYLLQAEPRWFGVSLAKASQTQQIIEKRLAADHNPLECLEKLANAYRRAPHVERTLAWLKPLLERPADNIAEFNQRLLLACCELTGINTPMIKASELIPHAASKGQQRIIELVEAVGGTHYLNPVGGQDLYNAADFEHAGIRLEFLQPALPPYAQSGSAQAFVPGLSIIDALMHNEPDVVGQLTRLGHIGPAESGPSAR